MYTAAASITNSISSVLTAGPPGGLCAAGKNLPVPLILLQPPYLLPASPVRFIETIWGRILACNRPMIAAGITLILAAVLLRRIPRLSKEDWIINSRRTITGLGILLIALSFTAGNGNGFGVGSGDGIGIGDETSSGSQQTQEDPDPDGEQDGSDDMEQDAGADRTGNSENPDRLPTAKITDGCGLVSEKTFTVRNSSVRLKSWKKLSGKDIRTAWSCLCRMTTRMILPIHRSFRFWKPTRLPVRRRLCNERERNTQ